VGGTSPVISPLLRSTVLTVLFSQRNPSHFYSKVLLLLLLLKVLFSLKETLSLSLWNQTPQCAVMMKVLFSLKETTVAFLFKGVPSLSPFLIHSLIHSRAHSLAAHYGATKGP
jgi:hypothetical protein